MFSTSTMQQQPQSQQKPIHSRAVLLLLLLVTTTTTTGFSPHHHPRIVQPPPTTTTARARNNNKNPVVSFSTSLSLSQLYSSSKETSSRTNQNESSTTSTKTTTPTTTTTSMLPPETTTTTTIWESMALTVLRNTDNNDHHDDISIRTTSDFVQLVTFFRASIPALGLALSAKIAYPTVALTLAAAINDSGVFAVVAQDASQYIQNICTTSGLVFGILLGQTYYFMYQQQEATYLALYEEVSMAKSLLEQVALVCQGRERLYTRILECMDLYVQTDLIRFNNMEPAILMALRPIDDPLEDILYLTSVGEPSIVYQTVKSLRTARAHRLGALQKKLPDIHMTLLWTLFAIVLFTFPLLGAGSQTIGGTQILAIQSYYLGFIVFGMTLTMQCVYELQRPGESGAYNARNVLAIMVKGLEDELKDRLNGTLQPTPQQLERQQFMSPSVDNDGFFDSQTLTNQ